MYALSTDYGKNRLCRTSALFADLSDFYVLMDKLPRKHIPSILGANLKATEAL